MGLWFRFRGGVSESGLVLGEGWVGHWFRFRGGLVGSLV